MILSCVRRIYDKLGYYVGSAMVARVLQGSREKKLLELGLDSLSTYGLLKDTGRSDIRAMADRLEEEGFLKTDTEYQTLRLTAEANQVLYHGKKVSMLVRREEINPREKTAVIKLSGSDGELYDSLRELRAELAKESGVPAYVIFSNATLTDMAKKKPRNMTEFKRVSGIGEIKAAWYGKPFLKRIKEFLEGIA